MLWWCFTTRALENFSWYIWCLSNLFRISFYVLHSWIWKSGLANLAESYNNVFAAVNLLRGTAVNAKILHVVINAGLVGHEASHQLKYDPGGEFSNWQNKNSEKYLLRPALFWAANFSHSEQNIATKFSAHNFSRAAKYLGFNHFSLSSQKNVGHILIFVGSEMYHSCIPPLPLPM